LPGTPIASGSLVPSLLFHAVLRGPDRGGRVSPETIEGAWRTLLDWPQRLGEQPAESAVAAARDAVALRPAASRAAGDPTAETIAIAAFGAPADEWLALQTPAELDRWADAGGTAAARFIRQNACEGLTVDAVCRHAGLARTQLEEKFRKFFGRSPNTEIRRVQLNRIRQLLQDTDLPLDAISELTGFKHPEYLIVFFKRAVGESPGRFRRKIRFQASLVTVPTRPTAAVSAPALASAPAS